jgi:hypothetical protein
MIGKHAITPDGREWVILEDLGDGYYKCQSAGFTRHTAIWHKRLLAIEVKL